MPREASILYKPHGARNGGKIFHDGKALPSISIYSSEAITLSLEIPATCHYKVRSYKISSNKTCIGKKGSKVDVIIG